MPFIYTANYITYIQVNQSHREYTILFLLSNAYDQTPETC